jgi:cyclopropane fatty-acyl-phospholipid synthase-like methyltransferase
MFEELEKINRRPKPFEYYTASDLWTDEYTSKQMLSYHLNEEKDLSSRNAAFIDKSVEWIATHFNIGEGIKIADFGCGPGLYTTKLAKYRAEVTGIDFSARSIQHAQEEASRANLSIQYVNQNYLEFETDDRFDLILMIFCDFGALSPAQRKKMLSKFHTFLKPGGSVLFDVLSMRAFENLEEQAVYEENLLDGFWSQNKYYGFLNTFKYEREKLVLDKYTIVETDRIKTIYNWLQCFSPEDIRKELVDCEFKVENYYSDVAGSPFDPESEEFAVIARKVQ